MNLAVLREKLITERDLDVGYLAGDPEKVFRRRVRALGISRLSEYARLLDDSSDEYDSLLRELLEPPRSFLADPRLTSWLQNEIVPSILARKSIGDSIRAWVPNCGDGYAAYDIALLFWKALRERVDDYAIRVIGTDTSHETLAKARGLLHSAEALRNIDRKGLSPTEDQSPIQHVRRLILFGVHDVANDPPYTRMDLIICRGVLPMLDADRRAVVTQKLVHSLALGGTLALGTGEMTELSSDPLAPERPFAVFIKEVPHPREIVQLASDPGKLLTRRHSALDMLRMPALALDENRCIRDANQAAVDEFSMGEDLAGKKMAEIGPHGPFGAIQEALEETIRTEGASAVGAEGEWLYGIALDRERHGQPQMAIVTLIPLITLSQLSESEKSPIMGVTRELTARTLEVAVGLHSHDAEVARLREQASILTESLYNRTQQLDSVSQELRNRNAELELSNESLREALTEREKAEEELAHMMEREHHIAEVLQAALIPRLPSEIGSLKIASKYTAAFKESDVGGDFYHFSRLRDDRAMIMMGDVSGKGLDAAVYGSMAKNMLLGFASEMPHPGLLLARLDKALALQSDGLFVTVVCLIIEMNSNRIIYGNGGHEPPILFTARTGKAELLMPTTRALAIMPSAEDKDIELDFQPGDVLVLYTDGLSDAGQKDERLGHEGIARIVANHAHEDADSILDAIFNAALTMADGKLTDDGAVVVIKREG